MKADFFIDRPVFSTVLSIIIVIVGAIGLALLPVDQYPQIVPPVVRVSASYPGADAQTVTQAVATPIEQELNGTPGMIYMESSSSNSGGFSATVTFDISVDPDLAAVDVQNRLKKAEARLPAEVVQNGISVEKQAASKLMTITLLSSDPKFDEIYLSNYATLNVLDLLRRIPGVGSISNVGSRYYAMQIWVQPDKLADLGLTVKDLQSALKDQNRESAAGVLGQAPMTGLDVTIPITAQGRLSSVSEFEDIVIRANSDGSIIRLRDVATISLEASSYNTESGINGGNAAVLEIKMLPGANAMEVAELVKAGKIKEISDMRDETDLNGLKLTLDLKRGVDADKLMAKLFKTTPLEDSFSANFNILVAGQPRVMGVREILQEWTAFRVECVRRRTYYDLHGKEKRLHLLQGLAAILLDIDKAIKIIRTTEEESEVVPNLMIGFGIDEVQADYVAEIKLRHLNREYILKRTSEIEQLEKDIADLNDVLAKPARVRRIIINELNEVAKKYAQPRRSEILYDLPEEEAAAEEETVPDYPVTVFFTREGYLKKIPPQSLRTAGAHKLKEGDEIIHQVETRNNVEALFFTDKQQVYKVRLNELEDGKVAQMGIYLPGRLGMDEGENILAMVITGDYSGYVLFFFAGGKCAKIPLASYATKQNRRKLLKAYSDKEPLAKLLFLPEDTELAIRTSAGRMLLVNTAQIAAKTTRDSQGVAVVTLKKNQTIASVVPAETLELANPHRYRVRSLPATGALIRAEDEGEQLTML